MKKHIVRQLSGLFCLALFSLSSVAQADPFVMQNDLQMWQIASMRGHFTKRIMGYIDVQNNEVNLEGRKGFSSPGTHYGQILVRPALGFQVTKSLSFWQGYGWTPSFQPQFRNENQIWEQILWERKFEHLHNMSVSNRSRLEIRRIADAGGTALRFRNQFRVAMPLGKTRWSLVAYDEPFINLNTVGNGPRSGFNQNWLFFGLNRKLTGNLSAELGYLNNYVNNPLSSSDRMNHVIMVSMNLSPKFGGIDLRKNHIDEKRPRLQDLLKNKDKASDESTSTAPVASSTEEAAPLASTEPMATHQPDLEIMPVSTQSEQSGKTE